MAVLHYEMTSKRTACGRLWFGEMSIYTTDDLGQMEDREGSRCKSCWRAIVAGHLLEDARQLEDAHNTTEDIRRGQWCSKPGSGS